MINFINSQIVYIPSAIDIQSIINKLYKYWYEEISYITDNYYFSYDTKMNTLRNTQRELGVWGREPEDASENHLILYSGKYDFMTNTFKKKYQIIPNKDEILENFDDTMNSFIKTKYVLNNLPLNNLPRVNFELWWSQSILKATNIPGEIIIMSNLITHKYVYSSDGEMNDITTVKDAGGFCITPRDIGTYGIILTEFDNKKIIHPPHVHMYNIADFIMKNSRQI